MTLVVARIENQNIYIESDSKITDENAIRSNPLCGLLKTLILHPCVCVSFAGNVHYAEQAINRFFQNNKFDNILPLIQLLVEANIESGNTVDFIVATINGRVPRLYKITDGTLEQDISNAWIGDHDGFSVYQKGFIFQEEGIDIKDRMRNAFKAVVQDPSIETIGDFHMSTSIDRDINPAHPVFLHSLKVEIEVTEPQTIKFEEKGECKPVPLGTAAGGAHGVSYLVTVCPEFHGVAIHFTHGNFGVLFCPQISFNTITIRDVDGGEFVERIKDQYGIPLRGFIKTNDSAIQFIDNRELHESP